MSDYMDEIKLWTPVFASSTSRIGQYFVLEKHPPVVSEQALNVLTNIIDDYRQQELFQMVAFLEEQRTLLELSIEKGPEHAFSTYKIENEELEISLLVSLQVYIQASTWSLNMSQIMRGPELLSEIAINFLSNIQGQIHPSNPISEIVKIHKNLLSRAGQAGINGAFSLYVDKAGDQKGNSIPNILEITKLLSGKYKTAKSSYVKTKGLATADEIVQKIQRSPALNLSGVTTEYIRSFSELLCVDSLDQLHVFLSEHAELMDKDTISGLTSLESGDIRGLRCPFHSVEMIRILTLASQVGLDDAITRLKKQYGGGPIMNSWPSDS